MPEQILKMQNSADFATQVSTRSQMEAVNVRSYSTATDTSTDEEERVPACIYLGEGLSSGDEYVEGAHSPFAEYFMTPAQQDEMPVHCKEPPKKADQQRQVYHEGEWQAGTSRKPWQINASNALGGQNRIDRHPTSYIWNSTRYNYRHEFFVPTRFWKIPLTVTRHALVYVRSWLNEYSRVYEPVKYAPTRYIPYINGTYQKGYVIFCGTNPRRCPRIVFKTINEVVEPNIAFDMVPRKGWKINKPFFQYMEEFHSLFVKAHELKLSVFQRDSPADLREKELASRVSQRIREMPPALLAELQHMDRREEIKEKMKQELRESATNSQEEDDTEIAEIGETDIWSTKFAPQTVEDSFPYAQMRVPPSSPTPVYIMECAAWVERAATSSAEMLTCDTETISRAGRHAVQSKLRKHQASTQKICLKIGMSRQVTLPLAAPFPQKFTSLSARAVYPCHQNSVNCLMKTPLYVLKDSSCQDSLNLNMPLNGRSMVVLNRLYKGCNVQEASKYGQKRSSIPPTAFAQSSSPKKRSFPRPMYESPQTAAWDNQRTFQINQASQNQIGIPPNQNAYPGYRHPVQPGNPMNQAYSQTQRTFQPNQPPQNQTSLPLNQNAYPGYGQPAQPGYQMSHAHHYPTACHSPQDFRPAYQVNQAHQFASVHQSHWTSDAPMPDPDPQYGEQIWMGNEQGFPGHPLPDNQTASCWLQQPQQFAGNSYPNVHPDQYAQQRWY